MEKIIGTVPGKCRKKREKARLTLNNNPEISWHMKKSRRTYNGVHLNKKSNTQDVVEQSLTQYWSFWVYFRIELQSFHWGNIHLIHPFHVYQKEKTEYPFLD